MSKTKTKTHYAEIDKANEFDNNDYWYRTICGLNEHEVEVSDNIKHVSCKKCLKSFPKYKMTLDNQNNIDYF